MVEGGARARDQCGCEQLGQGEAKDGQGRTNLGSSGFMTPGHVPP